jgi:hypothetical protein
MDEQLTNEECPPLKDISDRTNLRGCQENTAPVVLTFEKDWIEENPYFVIPKEARIWENRTEGHWYEQRVLTEIQHRTRAEKELETLKNNFDNFVRQMNSSISQLNGILQNEQIEKFKSQQFTIDANEKKSQESKAAEKKLKENEQFMSDLKAAIELMQQGYKPNKTAEEPKKRAARKTVKKTSKKPAVAEIIE